tara:strand:+ start:1261 stop:1497 length:237 start_codon:yes stop_codon:yes gene_type:complete
MPMSKDKSTTRLAELEREFAVRHEYIERHLGNIDERLQKGNERFYRFDERFQKLEKIIYGLYAVAAALGVGRYFVGTV